MPRRSRPYPRLLGALLLKIGGVGTDGTSTLSLRENSDAKIENPEPELNLIRGFIKDSGSVLLGRSAARAVPSAQSSLTSVFGMGTGVTSTLSPPENRIFGVIQSGIDLLPIVVISF